MLKTEIGIAFFFLKSTFVYKHSEVESLHHSRASYRLLFISNNNPWFHSVWKKYRFVGFTIKRSRREKFHICATTWLDSFKKKRHVICTLRGISCNKLFIFESTCRIVNYTFRIFNIAFNYSGLSILVSSFGSFLLAAENFSFLILSFLGGFQLITCISEVVTELWLWCR